MQATNWLDKSGQCGNRIIIPGGVGGSSLLHTGLDPGQPQQWKPMEFWDHLKQNAQLDLQGVSGTIAGRFAELLSRGHSVADLLAHYGEEFGHLPVETLRSMANALRTYLVWRKRRQQLEEAYEGAGLPPVPAQVYRKASTADQLDAILRTARLCPKDRAEGEEQWIEVLEAGVELWARGMALARKDGTIRCEAASLDHPEQLSEYDAYVKHSDGLAELAPHRWLAMRRGERAGLLVLKLELPAEGLLEEVVNFKERLGPTAAEREPESLLDELILDDLQPWLLRILDSEAQNKAIKSATEALAGLLRTSAIQVRQLGAVYFTKPGAPAAAVVTDRDGDLVAQKVIRAEGPWLDKVVDFLEGKGVQHVVLPTSALTPEFVSSLEAKLDDKAQVIKVRPAALSEAKRPLTDPPLRLGASAAAAVVLARRALDPLKEWSSVDPVGIGVAEYQSDLDTDMLRAALKETAELCRLERRRGRRVQMGGSVPRGNTAMAKLNPLVKSLTDLKAGMTVYGMVTNISHFGAFVNVGLPQEALVHISELSDSFVTNPNEVVSIGQQVNAHVLAVDPARGRISLSLKTLRRRGPMERSERRDRPAHPLPQREPREMRGGGGGDRRERRNDEGPPMSKAEALANLEKLFKKDE